MQCLNFFIGVDLWCLHRQLTRFWSRLKWKEMSVRIWVSLTELVRKGEHIELRQTDWKKRKEKSVRMRIKRGEREYLMRGRQSSCSLISSVRWKRKGGSKLQFLPQRHPENCPQTHPTSRLLPLHATTHTHTTHLSSAPAQEGRVLPKIKMLSSLTHSSPVLFSFFYGTQKAAGISELIFSVQQKWMVIYTAKLQKGQKAP